MKSWAEPQTTRFQSNGTLSISMAQMHLCLLALNLQAMGAGHHHNPPIYPTRKLGPKDAAMLS
jgi:hypothetical protein